jgi:hypothetical protein
MLVSANKLNLTLEMLKLFIHFFYESYLFISQIINRIELKVHHVIKKKPIKWISLKKKKSQMMPV